MTFDADELEKRIVDKLAKDSIMYPVTYTMRAFVHALCLALQEMQEAQERRAAPLVDCPKCGGTGGLDLDLPDESFCHACGGTGYEGGRQ